MPEVHHTSDAARQQGIIMLVVLWMLTSAVILVASFNGAVRSGAASAVSEIGLTKSEALLDAGLEVAAAHLLDQDDTHRWQGNGKKQTVIFAGAELSIEARDANGLVDLNKSDRKLLEAVFQTVTRSASKAKQYADAIMNARDAENNKGPSPGDNQQPASTNTFANPLAFADVWQIAQLSQIPTDVVRRAAPYLTVFSREGTIDPRAAPELLLTSIPGIGAADLVKLRYADTTALSDLIQKSDGLLTDQNGPAFIVKVQSHQLRDDYSMSRTFAILVGIDPAKPYRLLTKWPIQSIPAKGSFE